MGSSVGKLNPKYNTKEKKATLDLYGGKTPSCYMCSKAVKKKDKYAEVDIIISPSGGGKNDGLVIKTQVHDDCIYSFYMRFLEICGMEAKKCGSEKKRKK